MTEKKDVTVYDLRQNLRGIKKSAGGDVVEFGSRQTNPEEGIFTNAQMQDYNLLAPPYDPFKLYRIVESSGTLGACIEVMVDNVDGFGHDLQYEGEKEDLKNPKVMQKKKSLNEFFKKVNETQSFTKLRKEIRRDSETTGNGYMELVRYKDDDIATLYRADARYMRLQAKQKEEVEVTVNFTRNGKVKPTKIKRRFRRFAMITNTSIHDIRWFKEYGDPRKMCAITGKYENELEGNEKIKEEASEIIHFKQGNDTYGIPKWVGMSSTVLGVRDADYVNYDLFGNQAIPPLAILVSGGRLTSESVQDLINIFQARKGVENFHKIAILEAAPADGDIDDIASQAKIDFKPLPQQDDILFGKYIDSSEKRIRAKFRIPALYLGRGEEFSRATSQNIKLITEEQCFRPERNDFDEIINFTLMTDLDAGNWHFRTTGPKLIEGAEAIDAIGKFARSGALSINKAIKVMNRVLDLDMPMYDQPWADYPAAIVLDLAKQGTLKDIQEIAQINTNDVGEAKETITNQTQTLKSTEGYESLAEDLETIKLQMEEIYDMMVRGE